VRYAVRIGHKLRGADYHYYTGGEAYGLSLWSREIAMAATFPSREAADEAARLLGRWLNSDSAAIVLIEGDA